MKHKIVRAGPLTTHLIDVGMDDGARPGTLVVLCHGFGAPGTDLVPLAGEITRFASLAGPRLAAAADAVSASPPTSRDFISNRALDRSGGETAPLPRAIRGVRFAFPEAPLDLAELGYAGARAWFPIDVDRLMSEGPGNRAGELALAAPEGMDAARRALTKTVEALLLEAGLSWERLILGGFSQGAMMAIELTLSADEGPAGLWAWSPALVDRAAVVRRAPRRAGLRAIVSHGRQDAILPFAGSVELSRLLEEAGLRVRFTPFHGPHTIPAEAIEQAALALAELAGGLAGDPGS